MYIVVWVYKPAPAREAEFVAGYGPGGPWADLFRKAGYGFLDTELYRKDDPVLRAQGKVEFLVVDLWRSRAAHSKFFENPALSAEYDALNARFAKLRLEESFIGAFELEVCTVDEAG